MNQPLVFEAIFTRSTRFLQHVRHRKLFARCPTALGKQSLDRAARQCYGLQDPCVGGGGGSPLFHRIRDSCASHTIPAARHRVVSSRQHPPATCVQASKLPPSDPRDTTMSTSGPSPASGGCRSPRFVHFSAVLCFIPRSAQPPCFRRKSLCSRYPDAALPAVGLRSDATTFLQTIVLAPTA